jgi:hypothetical protein
MRLSVMKVDLRGGQVRAAFAFTIDRGQITGVDLIMDPGYLCRVRRGIH